MIEMRAIRLGVSVWVGASLLGACVQARLPQAMARSTAGETTQERVVGIAFRGLAKAYVAVADVDRLKTGQISRIDSMTEREFSRRFARILAMVPSLPLAFKATYGVKDDMGKEDVERFIATWDRERMCAMADDIPDAVIMTQLKGYCERRGQELGRGNAADQVRRFWRRIRLEIDAGGTQNPK